MKKEKCILCGPVQGEFYWEIGNFAPYIFWKRKIQYKKRNDIKFIAITRPERFDIYGQYVDEIIPFVIDGDESKYIQSGFKLLGLPGDIEKFLLDKYVEVVKEKYEIIEHITPNTSKKEHCNRNQFPRNNFIYEYKPRIENKAIIDDLLNSNKKNIVLAPRFRKNVTRNWNRWQEFYDLIYNSKLFDKFNFIICGNDGQYIPDNKNRFYDISKLTNNKNVSACGLLLETINRSILTVGSQSAIPNISLLLGVEALEWGNQKYNHTILYNPRKTKVTFFEDFEFKIDEKIIFLEMKKILEKNR